ncbi:MAG: hypothetical protein Kilf2KO_32190 [Rhodospirillales bacterium]
MSKILVYPSFERQEDCAAVMARLCWHLGPYQAAVTDIALLSKLAMGEAEPPDYLAPDLLSDPGTAPLRAKMQVRPPPGDLAAWRRALSETDRVLIWRQLDEDPLAAALVPEKTSIIDEAVNPDATADLADWALTLLTERDQLLATSEQRFTALRQQVAQDQGYLYGTGPSVLEAARYRLKQGQAIVCNDIVGDADLMEQLQPLALVLGDPRRHAGPSAAAAAFRQSLTKAMQQTTFWVFVPLRDYPLYLAALPEALRDRFIGVPALQEAGDNLDLTVRFAVRRQANVMTHMMLPLAASLFRQIGICGADGRPEAQEAGFWRRHGQLDAAMEESLRQAHPAYVAADQSEAYRHYCRDLKRIVKALEAGGKTVTAITASHVPALRQRGAAAPLPSGNLDYDAVPATLLSMTPDLRDQVGHFWNYEQKLGPMIESGGHPYWIAANALWSEAEAEATGSDSEKGETDEESRTRVDCNLFTFSWTLANKPEEDDDYRAVVGAQVLVEFAETIDRALAACSGRLHIYMYVGSLDHAALLYEIARERPRVSAHVNLFWFRSSDTWEPKFLKKWMWLLRAAKQDPHLTITAMTAHQRRQVLERSGVDLAVAKHPSPLIGDSVAWRLLNEPKPARRRKRVFFPSANRPEKGTALLFDTARLLVEQHGDLDLELLFRTSPFDPKSKPEEDPLFPYVTLLEGHIEEADFIDALRMSDAVVLPYLPPDFSDRTSGIVIDALYAGAPSVVMRGTYLAEIVQRYGCGLVVDEGRPEEVAAATATLLRADDPQAWDFRESAKLYFRAHSWQRLAQEVISSLPTAETAPPVTELPDSDAAAVALLGPVPRAQAGSIDLTAATLRCLAACGVESPAAALLDSQTSPIAQVLRADGKCLTVAANSRAADLTRTETERQGPALAAQRQIEPLGPDLATQIAAFADDSADMTFDLLIGNDPDLVPGLLQAVQGLRPKAVLIAFDEEVLACHANLAEALDDLGYLVLVSEQHPRLRTFEEEAFWRLSAYPHISDLPWAKGTIVALPAEVDLAEVKAAFLESGRNLEFQEIEDPAELGAEIWAQAQPVQESTVLAAAAAPDKTWKPVGLDSVGQTPDGFAVLTETPSLMVHRSYLPFTAKTDQPLTLALDLAEMGRRFVVLWLTDEKNQPRAEAILDLRTGKVIAARSLLEDCQVFAVALPIAKRKSGVPIYRAWMSLDRYPTGEKLQAQIVTRAASTGSIRHLGEANKGVLVRNFLVEAQATPSRPS